MTATSRPGDPVPLHQLHRTADGRPWTVDTPAGTSLYLLKSTIGHLAVRHLSGTSAPGEQEVWEDVADRVTTAVSKTLDQLHR